MKKHQIAILVSGKGTNALNIIQYFEKNCSTRVVLLVSNKMNSQAIKKARNKGIESVVFNNEWFKNNENFLNFFKSRSIDLIVLAGFLLKIPEELTIAYKKKIINIHPSLLPKFGGKGMYGDHVHEAVIRAHETESGITIHYVIYKCYITIILNLGALCYYSHLCVYLNFVLFPQNYNKSYALLQQ